MKSTDPVKPMADVPTTSTVTKQPVKTTGTTFSNLSAAQQSNVNKYMSKHGVGKSSAMSALGYNT